MAVGEDIFPKGCWLHHSDDGRLSDGAAVLLEMATMDDWNGQGAEHPCYGCRVDPCQVRQVEYHDAAHRYIVPPRGARTGLQL